MSVNDHEVKQYLHGLFTIKDLGAAKYFLGIKLARSPEGMLVTQSKYISDSVQDMGLVQAKAKNTPLPTLKLSSDTGDPLTDPSRCRRLVGGFFTRLDASYAVQHLSLFLQWPCQAHWDAAVHLVKYLKSCHSTRLFFSFNNVSRLTAFFDADWAGCPETRRSLTGFCIFLNNAPVS
ncbi:uncharacterized protein LOC110012699 [Sesamum indicum]|uniref:Uncharacterized protein LOC110012699 n=1 Tax=Sesamum indicum TaxID=4182 RepID=A0A8M8V9Y0_SESIN|nr:uncharacterized protein LOC110012699 [Sesamum indicum]